MGTPKKHPNQKEIDEAFNTINADQAECDKQLLTLSSAFLAVSLAFIKDTVKLPDTDMLWALYTAWILLGLCIMLVLFSYQYSIAGNFKAKHYWENVNTNLDLKFPYGYATSIKWLNRVSGVLFGLGVFFLVLFIICNIRTEAAMSPRILDGSNMRTPQQGDLVQKGSNIKAPPAPQPVQPKPNTTNSGSSTGQGQPAKKN
jgi:hypothetical protein